MPKSTTLDDLEHVRHGVVIYLFLVSY